MRLTHSTTRHGRGAAMARTRSESKWLLVLGVATLVAAAGCSMKETGAPDLTGPSGLGTSVAVSASPDILSQDGVSTSQIVVEVRDASNEPVRGLGVRLDMFVNADSHDPTSPLQLRDVGKLSTKSPVTGSDGRAVVTYTAPLGAPKNNTVLEEILLTITATPIDHDFSSALPRSVRLRLVPLGIIIE
jgi:hypothetical protein